MQRCSLLCPFNSTADTSVSVAMGVCIGMPVGEGELDGEAKDLLGGGRADTAMGLRNRNSRRKPRKRREG